MMLSRDFRAVVWSGVFTAVFVIAGALWISSGDFVTDLFGPAIVASGNVASGAGDLMTIFDRLFPDSPYRIWAAIALLMSNLLFVAWFLRNRGNPLFRLSLAGASSLIFLTHLGYDGVFLLPAVVYFFAGGGKFSLIGLIAIMFSWQVVKVLDVLGILDHSIEWILLQALSYVVVVVCILFVSREEPRLLIVLRESQAINVRSHTRPDPG